MSSSAKPLIILGVTGGIAVYKAADLCSKMVQSGYEVQVVMTENATKLVTPLTFLTLSRNPVITSLWNVADWRPEHVALAERASLLVVAPATVNFIGKYTWGIADDALTTVAATHRKGVLIAPAMNPAMLIAPALRENMEKLRARGVHFVGPVQGHVACGADGVGRMSDPADILAAVHELIKK